MRIDAVTVCVGCGDYLPHTIPQNRSLFDRWVIVTSSKDEETQRVCDYYNIESYVTDVMYDSGQRFNKGAAVNAGLEYLKFKEWAVHLDADIVLPARTKSLLEDKNLNEQFLFGCDRWMVSSYEDWADFVANPIPMYENGWIHQPPFRQGPRLFCPQDGGYVPIGYFQLFHREAASLTTPLYPTHFDTAASSDTAFARQWPGTHRHLLPEVHALHLGTEDQKLGSNWDGRITARFGPRPQFGRRNYVR